MNQELENQFKLTFHYFGVKLVFTIVRSLTGEVSCTLRRTYSGLIEPEEFGLKFTDKAQKEANENWPLYVEKAKANELTFFSSLFENSQEVLNERR